MSNDPEDPTPEGPVPDNVVKHPSSYVPYTRYDLEVVPTLPESITREIPKGTLSTLAGEGGVGKSYIALDMAISVALGAGEFARPLKRPPRTVFYVDSENGSVLMRARYHALMRGRGLDPENPRALGLRLHIIDGSGFNLDDPIEIHRLGYEMKQAGAGLLILDSFMAMTGIDVTSNTDVRRLLDTKVRLLTRTGAAVVGLHHIRKLTGKGILDGRGQGIMGARAWIDAVDEAFVVRAVTPNKLSFEHVKGRSAGTHDTFVLGLDLPPMGTPVTHRRSTIKDLGSPQDTLSKVDAAKVHVLAVLTQESPMEVAEVDKKVMALAACGLRTAISARLALAALGHIMPVDASNRKSPVALVVDDE